MNEVWKYLTRIGLLSQTGNKVLFYY